MQTRLRGVLELISSKHKHNNQTRPITGKPPERCKNQNITEIQNCNNYHTFWFGECWALTECIVARSKCICLWPLLTYDYSSSVIELTFIKSDLVGRCGSGGRAVVWQSEGCWFDSTLGVSKCPWARHLTPNCSWRAGCMAADRCCCVNGCVNRWMRGINCKALWIKALYKCSPFTIYLQLTKRETIPPVATWG